MTAYFFDTSAIVKRYYFERGSAWVKAMCESRSHPPLYLSELSRVEFISALRRTGRNKQLHPSYIDTMINTFTRQIVLSDPSRDNPIYPIIPLSEAVTATAATLCDTYSGRDVEPIRTLDAIQLAAALLAAPTVDDELLFVTADTHLGAVAQDEGFRVINPAFPPSP